MSVNTFLSDDLKQLAYIQQQNGGIIDGLQQLLKMLSPLSLMQNSSAQIRVAIEAGTLPAITTITTVTTVSTVTNQAQSGGYNLNHEVMSQMNINVADAIRRNITR